MTKTEKILKYILDNPFENSEFRYSSDYYTKVAELFGSTRENCRNVLYRYRKKNNLIITKKTTHPNGKITTVESARNPDYIKPSKGMKIKSITDLGYGVQNVKYVNEDGLNKDDILESIEDVIKNLKKINIKIPKVKVEKERIQKTIISDAHIGMNPQPEQSIYKFKYGVKEYNKSLLRVLRAINMDYKKTGPFERIELIDLGDCLDGQNKMTIRGGHELPQNLTNKEMFTCFLDGTMMMIKSLVRSGMAKKIVLRNMVNDNHSGDFGYYVAMAIKKICNALYDEDLVEIDIMEKFIETRNYGDHTFMYSHGKDKKYMKKGLPLELTPFVKNYISEYMDHHGLDNKYNHFEKGDLHQLGYGMCAKFDYRNFCSFAPPSAWIQHNFGDSYSGFGTQIVPKGSALIEPTHHPLDYRVR